MVCIQFELDMNSDFYSKSKPIWNNHSIFRFTPTSCKFSAPGLMGSQECQGLLDSFKIFLLLHWRNSVVFRRGGMIHKVPKTETNTVTLIQDVFFPGRWLFFTTHGSVLWMVNKVLSLLPHTLWQLQYWKAKRYPPSYMEVHIQRCSFSSE